MSGRLVVHAPESSRIFVTDGRTTRNFGRTRFGHASPRVLGRRRLRLQTRANAAYKSGGQRRPYESKREVNMEREQEKSTQKDGKKEQEKQNIAHDDDDDDGKKNIEKKTAHTRAAYARIARDLDPDSNRGAVPVYTRHVGRSFSRPKCRQQCCTVFRNGSKSHGLETRETERIRGGFDVEANRRRRVYRVSTNHDKNMLTQKTRERYTSPPRKKKQKNHLPMICFVFIE